MDRNCARKERLGQNKAVTRLCYAMLRTQQLPILYFPGYADIDFISLTTTPNIPLPTSNAARVLSFPMALHA